MRSMFTVALFLVASVGWAQSVRNALDRAEDRKELRQDQRQLDDDRLDLAQARKLLADYDLAIAVNNPNALNVLESDLSRHLAREIIEAQREGALAYKEMRRDKLKKDARPGAAVDDRRDVRKQRLSLARLVTIQSKIAPLAHRYDLAATRQKRALYAEVVGVEINELRKDVKETREDRRELREDRRK